MESLEEREGQREEVGIGVERSCREGHERVNMEVECRKGMGSI